MSGISGIDDIERRRDEEEMRKAEQGIFRIREALLHGDTAKKKEKKKGFFEKLIKFLLIIFLLITVVNLLLGDVWLLRYFIKSLFFG
jgi:hypothetical protein